MKTKIAALAALTLLASGVSARAQITVARESIGYDGAKQIVDTCMAMAKEKNWPIALWVLDITGQPVYFASRGSSEIGISTAKFKAESALRTGAPSGDRQGALSTPIGQLTTARIGLFPVDGGIPLIKNGKVIGSVGGGGGRPENGKSVDQICAQAGIDAVFKK